MIQPGDMLTNPVTGEVQETLAGPGDIAIVPPGTPHRFWNPGEAEARFLCEVRPAMQSESLIETMFTLAAEGKTNSKGMPNPFRLAVIAKAHFDTVRLPFPPALLQRAAVTTGASLGRMLGYRATAQRSGRDIRPHSRPGRTYDRRERASVAATNAAASPERRARAPYAEGLDARLLGKARRASQTAGFEERD
jgi:hypothetical protein